MKDYLKEYLYSYHWDPSKALLRALEARLMSAREFKEPILDLGCGDGVFTSVLLPESKVAGLDFRFRNTLKAKKKNFYSDLIVCDARNLAFKKETFNTVLMNCFLEHIRDVELEDVLSEANRILPDKGRFYLTLNSRTFGDTDPLVTFLEKIRCFSLSRFWQKYKNRRLALCSLKDYSHWSALFEKAGFKIIESHHYLSLDAEKRFFLWTELQYLGISRLNLGSLVRTFSKLLDCFGIDLHRRAIAAVFGKMLRKDYLDESKDGSCLFFALEKIEQGGLPRNPDSSKPEIQQLSQGEVQQIAYVNNPPVSVIIPSFDGYRDGNVGRLTADLKQQSFKEIEVIIVKKVSPQGKAINLGAARARGEILLIVDDDSRMCQPRAIENLVRVLDKDKSVGMVGASLMAPPEANWLQRRAAREFPRHGVPVVDEITESDLVCHGCCALPRAVFEKIGGERENIIRGLDPDLRQRLRQAGYKIVLAPHTWIYHALPATPGKLFRTFFRNGMGSAYISRFHPELVYETHEKLESSDFKSKTSLGFRCLRFPFRLLGAFFSLKFLRFFGYLAYGLGFVFGIVRYIRRPQIDD